VRFHTDAQVPQLTLADQLPCGWSGRDTPSSTGLRQGCRRSGRAQTYRRGESADVQAWHGWSALPWGDETPSRCLALSAQPARGRSAEANWRVRLGGFTPMCSACLRPRTPTARLW